MRCKTARTNTKTIVQEQNDFRTVAPKRLLQLSAAGEVFLEGTCPLSRCPQTAKFPAPCSGARRRWVRKATAFRGRSEQDRSALFAVCCYVILETFRWNVSNGISLCRNRRTRHAVSLQRVLRNCKLFSVLLGTTFATSHRDIAKIKPFLSGFTRGAVLFAPRKKLPLFVPFSVCPEVWARGFRRLRTAT